jgi:hypothetical protein
MREIQVAGKKIMLTVFVFFETFYICIAYRLTPRLLQITFNCYRYQDRYL